MGAFLIAFEPAILIVHFCVAFFLVSVILLQAGKGTDIGAMFGAGGSQSLFGPRGAGTLLSKMTTVTAIIFLVTSLSLATIANYTAAGGTGESVITDGGTGNEEPESAAEEAATDESADTGGRTPAPESPSSVPADAIPSAGE